MEIWKDIKGYEGLYQVSNLGRIKSLDKIIKQRSFKNSVATHIYKGKILMPFIQNQGYFYIGIMGKTFNLHRLVAKAFIPNPHNLPCVNHIDGNKQNNCVENLEWCSYSENMRHAVKNGLINFHTEKKKNSDLINIKKATESCKKKIMQYDTSGNFIKSYKSIIEASRETKSNATHISLCAKGKQKTCGGFKWRYE